MCLIVFLINLPLEERRESRPRTEPQMDTRCRGSGFVADKVPTLFNVDVAPSYTMGASCKLETATSRALVFHDRLYLPVCPIDGPALAPSKIDREEASAYGLAACF
jgi:hypothetical protein